MNSVTYVLYGCGTTNDCVLVDCGEYESLQPVLEELKLKPSAVLLTHGHSDHIQGLISLLESFPEIVVFTNEIGFEMLGNSKRNLSMYHGNPFEIHPKHCRFVQDGLEEAERIIGSKIEAIATPGHNPSCISYKIDKYLFTGDSYIPGVKVFTNFPKSNKTLAIESEDKLKQLEMEGYIVMPGHHSV